MKVFFVVALFFLSTNAYAGLITTTFIHEATFDDTVTASQIDFSDFDGYIGQAFLTSNASLSDIFGAELPPSEGTIDITWDFGITAESDKFANGATANVLGRVLGSLSGWSTLGFQRVYSSDSGTDGNTFIYSYSNSFSLEAIDLYENFGDLRNEVIFYFEGQAGDMVSVNMFSSITTSFDRATANVVPEPSFLALFALVLLGITKRRNGYC